MKTFPKSVLSITVLIIIFLSFNFKNNLNDSYKINECNDTIPPTFIGGEQALDQFLIENIKYPKEALKNGIQGKVIISFVIDNKGKTGREWLQKGIGYGCDVEAMMAVKKMPLWNPASVNGKPITVLYQLPVRFHINDSLPITTPHTYTFKEQNKFQKRLIKRMKAEEKNKN